MKTTITLAVLALTCGCTAFETLEQLEAEAMVTGDWSAVEQRERQLARRSLRDNIHCPSGQVGYCIVDLGDTQCMCVDQDRLNAFVIR